MDDVIMEDVVIDDSDLPLHPEIVTDANKGFPDPRWSVGGDQLVGGRA